jgi:GBP family porin
MNNVVLRAAFITAAGALGAQAVHAQSSVTLYGIVDTGLTFVNNEGGQKVYRATAGNVQGSRWGLMGTEDLGGGNKILFKLENGFDLNNGKAGQGARMFGRTAWVALSNSNAGTFTLGRQYNSVQDYLPNLQISGVGALSAYANVIYDNDSTNNPYRTNNAIKYTSPTVAGLTGNVMYAFSNAAGDFANNRAWSIGADYVAGPLRLDAAYARLDRPAGGTNPKSGALSADNYYSHLSNGIGVDVLRNQVWGAGGAYAFGPATVSLLYTNAHFDYVSGGSLRFANYQAGVRYQVTPTVLAAFGYIYTNQRSSVSILPNAHYNQFSLGGEYFLSKSTDLYLNGIYQRASGANAQIISVPTPSSTRNQFVAVTGIRHKF